MYVGKSVGDTVGELLGVDVAKVSDTLVAVLRAAVLRVTVAEVAVTEMATTVVPDEMTLVVAQETLSPTAMFAEDVVVKEVEPTTVDPETEMVGVAVAVVVGTNVGTLLGAGVGTPIDVKTRVTNPSLEAAALRVTVFAERSTATTVPSTEVDPDPVAGTVVAVAVLPITICEAACTEVITLLPLDKTPELGVVTA